MREVVVQHIAGATILFLAVGLFCALFRPGPAIRHGLWLLVLVKLLMPPLIQWPWEMPSPNLFFRPNLSAEPSMLEVIEIPVTSLEQPSEPATLKSAPSELLQVSQTSHQSARSTLLAHVLRNPLYPVMAVWLAGAACVALLQLIRGLRFARQIRRASPAPDWLILEATRLADRFEVQAPVIRIVEPSTFPAVYYLNGTRLVVPRPLVESLDRARWSCVIAHELAHLKRRDHWVRWLELVAGCVWWWNPVFWFTRRNLRESAELACDAWVVWALPDQRRAYAETLVDVSELISNAPAPIAALGMGVGARIDFERRLTMILRDSVTRNLSTKGIVALFLIGIASLPGIAFRAESDEPAPVPKDAPSVAALQKSPPPTSKETRKEKASLAPVLDSPVDLTFEDQHISDELALAAKDVPSAVVPEEPQPPTSKETSNEKTSIEIALDAPVDLAFEDQHISAICDFISDYLAVNMVIDYRVVTPRGQQGDPDLAKQYATDGMVRYLELHDMALKDALKAILTPLNVTFVPHDNFIWISSRDQIGKDSFPDVESEESSKIREALSAPVSIEFENEHVSAILAFLSEYLDVNIVLDSRAVPPKPEPNPSVSSAPGAFPSHADAQAKELLELTGEQKAALARSAFPRLPHRIKKDDLYFLTGVVPSIKLADLPLGEALKALLVPLDLYYKVGPGFIFVSSPELLAKASFEDSEKKTPPPVSESAATLLPLPFKVVRILPWNDGACRVELEMGGRLQRFRAGETFEKYKVESISLESNLVTISGGELGAGFLIRFRPNHTQPLRHTL